MNWLISMNKVIDYIENNLLGEIDIKTAAKIVSSNSYHFQRMFLFSTGFNFGEYIRKRRLTRAAHDIISSKDKIISIAFKYGYDSPEAFSRAFKSIHGISPSQVRNSGGCLKTFPRLSFQITLKGDIEMNYKIVKKPAFKIIGRVRKFSCQDNEQMQLIPGFWQDCHNDGFSTKICSLTNSDNITGDSILGVCFDHSEEQQILNYAIGVESNNTSILEGVEEIAVPAATWAIFESIGKMPTALQNVLKKIYSEWFPSTGYRHTGGPELEVYLKGDINDENYKCETWIPIKKK